MMASLYATPPADTPTNANNSTSNVSADLNGEDASVLSDTSNSSHTNSSMNSSQNHNQKAPKRSMLVTSPSTSINNYSLLGSLFDSNNIPDLSKKRRKQTTPIRISAFDLQQQQLQQLNQHQQNDNNNIDTINAINGLLSTAIAASSSDITEINDEDYEDDESASKHEQPQQQHQNGDKEHQHQQIPSTSPTNENETGNLQKIFLKNLSQLQAAAAAQHNNNNISNNLNNNEASIINENSRGISQQQQQLSPSKLLRASLSPLPQLNLNHHNGQQQDSDMMKAHDFENDIEAEYHNKFMKINNQHQQQNEKSPLAGDSSAKSTLWNGNKQQQQQESNNKKSSDDSWLSLASLPFPFPPEAAAALSASGYLPQLPLLSSVGHFGSADGVLPRGSAPLRIFNPEAYCDLCNKEFCNKYFLKTHKANKHGIYEPMTPMSSNDMPSLNQLTQMQQMSQVLQMQQQYNQAQQNAVDQQNKSQQIMSAINAGIPSQNPQQQQSNSSLAEQVMSHTASSIVSNNSGNRSSDGSVGSANIPNAFCDICFKKFSSPAALKKHRLKIHEIGVVKNPQQQQSLSSSLPQMQPVELTNKSNSCNDDAQQQQSQQSKSDMKERNPFPMPFIFPEGFREDFQVEQEDASFTPEPRKLSPASIQQARDANFSFDKLKRLGVVNPEAFCELCCKEYCNKYFLRTHKLKRHGVFIPMDDLKDESARALWPYMQTSPLNLIMSGDLKALQMYASKQKEFEQNHLQQLQQQQQQHLQNEQNRMAQQNDDNESNGVIKIPSSPANSDCDEMMKTEEKSVNIKTNGDEDDDDDENDENGRKSKAQDDDSKNDEPQLTPQESEAISVDLQKLQSMILQLNELNQNRSIPCAICGKEMDNQYMLHAHMLAEHSNFTNNNSIKLSPRPSSVPSPMPNDFEVCKQCDKEFSNIFLLKQHLMEQHGMPPITPPPLREGFITPDRKVTNMLSQPSTPTQVDRKQPSQMFQMTPTSSYCEICNKELCNKYFMKTHMQRMHGIEIENGAQIGGVVCNICNKELCSKYFLRVHKHNTHGIVEDGSPQQRPGSESIDSDNGFQMDLKPGEVSDQSNRYFSHFTEVCPLCSRRFRSAKWLKAHLMGDHGKAGVDKLNEIETKLGPIKAPSPGLKIPNGGYNLASPELMIKTSLGGLFSGENSMATSPSGSQNPMKGYQCSFCSFSTPILAILFIHERSHQASNSAMNLVQNKSESAVSLAKELTHSQELTPGISSPSSTPASTPIPSTPQESNSGKTEMNNLMDNFPVMHSRPSVGLPQESGPLVMQSFLMEESMLSKSLVNGKTGTNDNYKFIPSMVILPVRERVSSPITVSFTLTPA
jgi:hypothetical protein